MPGNKVSALLALSLLFAGPAWAKPEACGPKVQGYTEYEELDKDGKIVTKVSIFDLPVWSNDGGFEGVLVKSDLDPKTKIEIEVRKTKAKARKKTWDVTAWGERKDYLVAKDFRAADVFGEHHEADGTYAVRLIRNGKTLCEETRKIEKSHD